MSDDYSDIGRSGGKLGLDRTVPPRLAEPDHLDDVFHVLADRRRRYLLYCLAQATDGLAERSQLVDAVAAFEAAAPGEEEPPPAGSIESELHHCHLPRLADAGFVDYDRRQGTVRYDPSPSLEEWLEHAHYREVGRPR